MTAAVVGLPYRSALVRRLNTSWHQRALVVFALVIVAHWAEHLAQAVQIWGLGWARPEAGGVLGLAVPWLVMSEWLHYAYAVIMLAGLVALLPAFTGRARTWWAIAAVVQLWHHAEHGLLLYQAWSGNHLLGAATPTSLVQLLVPRVELHLVYNAVVTVPMVVAVLLHCRPRPSDPTGGCSCSRAAAPR